MRMVGLGSDASDAFDTFSHYLPVGAHNSSLMEKRGGCVGRVVTDLFMVLRSGRLDANRRKPTSR
jgi:hypothetical protein